MDVSGQSLFKCDRAGNLFSSEPWIHLHDRPLGEPSASKGRKPPGWDSSRLNVRLPGKDVRHDLDESRGMAQVRSDRPRFARELGQ